MVESLHVKPVTQPEITIDDAISRGAKIVGPQFVLFYPPGSTMYRGKSVQNTQLARRILESLHSGEDVDIPQFVDEWGNKLWELTIIPRSSE